MQRSARLVCLLVLSGCASLGSRGPTEEQLRMERWDAAHRSLAAGQFEQADSLFTGLIRDHPTTQEGRESLFYVGTLHLDPRNPRWDPAPAEVNLRQYLAADSTAETRIHRRPEGQTLYELARQLNLPSEDRIQALQNPTTVVRTPVVTPARNLAPLRSEIERLRRELEQRDNTIREQREEMERIRRTLTGQRRE